MTTTTLGSTPAQAERGGERELTSLQRLIVGGLGGVTPIVATLMAGEFDILPPLSDPDAVPFYVGFGLRIALFFGVGAVFVWLHQEVKGRYPVFRLGVTAPALIAAMIGTAPSRAADDRDATQPAALGAHAASILAVPGSRLLADLLPPTVVFGNCNVVDGFLGRKCD